MGHDHAAIDHGLEHLGEGQDNLRDCLGRLYGERPAGVADAFGVPRHDLESTDNRVSLVSRQDNASGQAENLLPVKNLTLLTQDHPVSEAPVAMRRLTY